MRPILTALLILTPCLLFGQTKETLPDPYYILLGKIHSILSEKVITSQQLFYGEQLIWMNARLGRVRRPKGMTRDTVIVTEIVPNDDGISISVGTPFDPDKVQGFKIPFHNTKRKEFLFWVPMPNHMVVQVSGMYGASFSEQLLATLFELTPAPPAIDNKDE